MAQTGELHPLRTAAQVGEARGCPGQWEVNDGILQHTSCEEAPLAICKYLIPFDHCTIECTARKDGGPEGFIIVFNYVDAQNYCWLNFGTGGNTQCAIEQISDKGKILTATRPGSVDTGKWYGVKLTLTSTLASGKTAVRLRPPERRRTWL